MPHKKDKPISPSYEKFKHLDEEVRPNSPQKKQDMLDTFAGEAASNQPKSYELFGHPKQMNFLEQFLSDKLGIAQSGYSNPLTGSVRVHPNLLSDPTKETGLRQFLQDAYDQSMTQKQLNTNFLRTFTGGQKVPFGIEGGGKVKPLKDIELPVEKKDKKKHATK